MKPETEAALAQARGEDPRSRACERRAEKPGGLYSAALAAAAIFFLVLACRLIATRGPIEMRAPATIVSNSHPFQRQLVPYLLFLAEVRRLLPAGASVAVFGPDSGSELAVLDYLVAIGQLPGNDVEPWQDVAEHRDRAPRFFAVYLREFSDDRYRAIAVLPSGHLYELRK